MTSFVWLASSQHVKWVAVLPLEPRYRSYSYAVPPVMCCNHIEYDGIVIHTLCVLTTWKLSAT